jgi:hypothetical protein
LQPVTGPAGASYWPKGVQRLAHKGFSAGHHEEGSQPPAFLLWRNGDRLLVLIKALVLFVVSLAQGKGCVNDYFVNLSKESVQVWSVSIM